MSVQQTRNEFYMMVGLPGTGKSTFCNQLNIDQEFTVISSDDIMEMIGKKYHFTYNELFSNNTYSFSEKMMFNIARLAVERNDRIIWDQTNLTVKSRANKLATIPKHYIKHAVVFNIPDDWETRLDRPGKTIPTNVLETMKQSFQMPTEAEGFDLVSVVRH
jgi:predicted kinase